MVKDQPMTASEIFKVFGIDIPFYNMTFKVDVQQFPEICITQVDIYYPWGQMLNSEEVDSKIVDWS